LLLPIATGAFVLFETLPATTARILRAGLIGTLCLLTLLSFTLTFLAMPAGDDYCRWGMSPDISQALNNAIEVYHIWSGRWATHTIYAYTFPHIDMHSIAYGLIIAVSPFLWTTVFYAFLDIIYRKTLTARFKLFLAVLLCATFWTGMSHQGDTWFWLTGVVEYELPMLLMALSLMVCAGEAALGHERGRQVRAFALSAFLAFLTTGLHELPGLLLLGCFAIGVALSAIRSRRDLMIAFGVLTAITAIGIYLNVAAPGTTARESLNFPNARNPITTINFLTSPRVSAIAWLGDIRLLCLTVIVLTVPVFARARPDWVDWKLPLPGPFSSMAATVPVITMLTVMAGFAVTIYAQGQEAPGRVRDILFAAFVGGWMASLVPLAARVSDMVPEGWTLRRPLQTGSLALFPVLLLIAPNTLYGIRDVPSAMFDWRPALMARYAEIERRAAAGEQDIVVMPIAADPKAYRWDDVATDPADWQNGCIAYKYKIRSLRSEPAPQQQPSRPGRE
jgi:hypothetical protein